LEVMDFPIKMFVKALFHVVEKVLLNIFLLINRFSTRYLLDIEICYRLMQK